MLIVDLLKYKIAILVHVVCPLLIGLAIYYFTTSIAFTHLIKNHFADGLWAYAFISAILLIWERQVNWFWIGCVVVVAFLFGEEIEANGHVFAQFLGGVDVNVAFGFKIT